MESDSNLFENLTTKTLSTVSASNIDALTRDIHLEKKNLDALHTTVLVNDASMRDGQPIPGSCSIKTVTVSDDTRTTLFEPEAGSVYVIQSITVNWTSKTGDGALILYQYDSTAGNITQLLWLNNTSTGSVVTTLNADSEFNWPIIVDENCYLQVLAGNDANWATCEFEAVNYRIR